MASPTVTVPVAISNTPALYKNCTPLAVTPRPAIVIELDTVMSRLVKALPVITRPGIAAAVAVAGSPNVPVK